MRLTQLGNQLRCISLRHRLWLTLGAALWLVTAAGCPEPIPDPPPPPPVAPPPPPVAPPPPPPPPPVQQVIVIHQADLHGQFEGKQGSTITIRALLMMTKTQPAVGNKGTLFYSPSGAQGEAEWVQLGDVEIKTPLNAESKLQVQITGDEKKFGATGGKKPVQLGKSSRIRLRWQW